MKRISSAVWVEVMLLASAAPATAQDLPSGFDETFAVSSLSPVLVAGADAVVRLNLLRFEVRNPGKATSTVRRVVTVLGPRGRDEGELYISYDDRLLRLEKLSGQIRDSTGSIVRKLGKNDQQDYSAVPDYSLYEQTRVRVARLYHDAYPYTVEFQYQLTHDGVINWPTWYPQERGLPVALTRFDLVTSPNAEVRYKVLNATMEPTVLLREGHRVMRWELSDAPAVAIEPFGPVWQDQVIAVHTAPTVFEIEGAQGDMGSWEAFGRWYGALNQGRTDLPPEARAEVHQLTSGLSTDRERVQRLYAHLQESTRYVSIQLGLGGWQSFDAKYVVERGYGDCKALTTYMRALLEEAGIASFPALVQGGDRMPKLLTDFPSNQFNHMILYVALDDGEGIWLESTSRTMPFGHLGVFTEGRYALLIRPEGGQLVRTPRSQAHENMQVRNTQVHLASAGDATVRVRTRYTGDQQDGIRQRLATRSGRARNEWLAHSIDLPSFELTSVDFSDVDGARSDLTLPMVLSVPRYAARSGKRLFVPVNQLERWTFVPPLADERANPIEFFSYPFIDVDTTRFEPPPEFTVEAMPDSVAIETAFGRYQARVEVERDGVLAYYRRVEIDEATLPAEQYSAFRDFMRRIAEADRAQVVLVAQ